jgi:phospho-N-acetylmuramoyl-pentapeptide-transferase
MLLLLLNFLQTLGYKIPNVFFYSSTRMMLGAMSALIITIFVGPYFIKKLYELKIGQPIRSLSECPILFNLHKDKKNTPTMGGILILFSMLICLFLFMDLKDSFTLILLFSTLFLGFVGGLDDYFKLRSKSSKGLKARYKFLSQILLGAIIAVYLLVPFATKSIFTKDVFKPPMAKEQIDMTKRFSKMKYLTTKEYISKIYVPFVKKSIFSFQDFFLGNFLFFILIVFIIVGSSNAVNLTDGLDGLASGCLIMVATVFAIFAFLSNNFDMSRYLNILYIENSGEIAVYLISMAGALLGFLWYNGHPAQVFMGDTGSLALGGILGVSSILIKREFLLALVGGIFVIEALSVILQILSYRYRNKKRIFLCAPLHHHFQYKGWDETKIVLRFWIVGLLLAIIGLSSLKFQ